MMVNVVNGSSWCRGGVSLIWNADALAQVSPSGDTHSLRQFFLLRDTWSDDLPYANGHALIVSGLEGLLDILSPDEIDTWLQEDFRLAVLSFQTFYEGQGALLFWLPSGHSRIEFNRAQERYYWKRRHTTHGSPIHLGRLIYAGAETEIDLITLSDRRDLDPTDEACAGLYHPRIS